MTKRRLYAQLGIAFLGLCSAATGAAGQRRAPDPPCGACLMVAIETEQARHLPEDLGGITVLVRVNGPPNQAVTEALGEIRRRGGRSGIALLRQEADLASIERLAFDLKQTLTEYRAASGSSAVMAVVTPQGVRQRLLDSGLDAYADVFPKVLAGDVWAALKLTREGAQDLLLD